MAYVFLILLIALKHWGLAVGCDVGYSNARSPTYRRWPQALFLHCLAEAAVSLVLLCLFEWYARYGHPTPYVGIGAFVFGEALAGVVACLLERRAPWYDLVHYHVTAEGVYWVMVVLSLYGFLVSP